MTSIVIITFNQWEILSRTLDDYLDQRDEDFEICVIDKNSEDDTVAMLEQMEENEPRLHHIVLPTSARAINKDHLAVMLGIRQSLSDRIIILRAQCAPYSNTWLHNINSIWQGDKSILLIPEMHKKKLSFGQKFAIWRAERGHARWALGHILGYSKKFFMDNGGFPPAMPRKAPTFDILVRYFSKSNNTQILKDAKYSVHSVVS